MKASSIGTMFIMIMTPIVGLILLSWNSLPGQSMYEVKLTMEEIPRFFLAVSPSTASSYDVTIANRRIQESTKLLDSHRNSVDLAEAISSINKAKGAVLSSNNDQAKNDLITTLKTYRQKLDDQRSQMSAEIHLQTSPETVGNLSSTDLSQIQYKLAEIESINKSISLIDKTIADLNAK